MAVAQGVSYPGASTPTLSTIPLPGREETSTTSGRTWRFEPSVDALFTLTDNVNLTTTDRKYDFVTQLTPGLRFSERGAHTRVDGTIQAPILLYARTGSENNDVRPHVDIRGTAELVERTFYIEGAVNVSQQYLSAFGPRPTDLVSATNNRYTAQSYRVTPIFKGNAGTDLSYELRDDSIWSNENNTTSATQNFVTQNSYTNHAYGTLAREARPVGWSLEYDRSDTQFASQPPLLTELSRARLIFRQDATLEWSLAGGYENNDYPGVQESGAIYGFGVKWHPTDRTNVDGYLEHRFFGESYKVTIDHRTPLSVWSIRASRDVTTYPQQLAAFAGGEDVGALLNQLFSSRVADPQQRQQFVEQFIRERGLPATMAGPLALFTEQATLQEAFEARGGLIGARNSVTGTLYRVRSEPVAALTTGLPDLLLAQNNNTQTGGSIVWTFKMTPLYTLSTSLDYSRTVENATEGAHTRQITFTTLLAAPLSPLTRALLGARWQRLYSNIIGNDYREAAVFVGINHVFR